MKYTLLLIIIFMVFGRCAIAQNYPSSPSEIGLIGAGVDYSDLTVYPQTGTIHLSAGIYEYYDFRDCNIEIDTDGVIIRKCRILWSGASDFVIRNYRHHPIIEDCEIDGQGYAVADGIAGDGYSLIRSWLHNLGNDGMKANGDVHIDRSWIGPLVMEEGGHNDLVQTIYGTEDPIIFTNSVFEGHLVTGENINVNCLRLAGEMGPVGNVIIEGNHFIGAGYQITFDVRPECTYKVINNVFETDYTHGHFYPTGSPVNVLWDNNKTASGAPIAIPGTSDYSALYGTVPDIPYPTYGGGEPSSGNNLALGKPATADSEYNSSYTAENAVDGNNSDNASRWLSANSYDDHWIEIDLGQISTITQVNFWTGFNGEYNYPIANYQIQYRDGSSWIDAVSVTGNSLAAVSHSLNNIITDKIRLYTTSSSSEIIRLYEIEVIGEAAQQQQTLALNPIADAYVRGGTSENTNFGSSSTLYVKDHSLAEYTRKSYLKFDLSSVSTVNNAYLRLYVNSLDGSSVHSVAFISNDYWTENGITYISSESTLSAGNSLNQWNIISSGQYVEVDITSIVATEAGGLLSLQIVSTDGQYVGYDSREGSNPPELLINDPSKNGLVEKQEINVNNTGLEIELWPNPVSLNELFHINFKNYESDENATVRILDIRGKLVYSKRFMNVSGKVLINPCINSGFYLLNISNKSLNLNNRLIIK